MDLGSISSGNRHHYIFPDNRQEWHPGKRVNCGICTSDYHQEDGRKIVHVNHPDFSGRPKVTIS